MVFNAKYGFFNCDIKTHKVVQKYNFSSSYIYYFFKRIRYKSGNIASFRKSIILHLQFDFLLDLLFTFHSKALKGLLFSMVANESPCYINIRLYRIKYTASVIIHKPSYHKSAYIQKLVRL